MPLLCRFLIYEIGRTLRLDYLVIFACMRRYLRGKGYIFLYRRFGPCPCLYFFWFCKLRCFEGALSRIVPLEQARKSISEERAISSCTGGSDSAFVCLGLQLVCELPWPDVS